MGGRSPQTVTGGHDDFQAKLRKYMGLLGNIIGFGIFFFTLSLMVIEVVLNPIFLFAQAKESGVQIGTPLTSLSWWIVIFITFATTGIQYALLQPGGDRSGIGYKFGWAIAIMDTLMDGGGMAAWLDGGDFFKLSGDSTNLFLGTFPPLDSHWSQWFAYVFICVVCLLHEPFLSRVLGRYNFTPAPGSSPAVVNISKWTERAGKLYNTVKLYAISFAPYILLSLDMLLFPQSVKGQGALTSAVFFVMTVAVTLLAIMVWEWYNHVRTGTETHPGIPFKELDVQHKGIVLFAFTVVLIDSALDLRGFNMVVFGQDAFIPVGYDRSLPFFLTAGMIMAMVTAFEPMNSHLFAPLARMADAGGPDFLGGTADGSDDYDPPSPFAGGADDYGSSSDPYGKPGGPDDPFNKFNV